MIELHCDTCDAPIELSVTIDGARILVQRTISSECSCPHTQESLWAMVEDAYSGEMQPERFPKDM